MPEPRNSIGYSFAPTFENAEMAGRNAAISAPQGPLQVLSYRLKKTPAVTGSFSPLASDRAPRTGIGNSALIQSVLRTVLGDEAAQAFLSSIDSQAGMADPGVMHGGAGNPFSPGASAPVGGAGGGGRSGPARSGPGSPFGNTWHTGSPGPSVSIGENLYGESKRGDYT